MAPPRCVADCLAHVVAVRAVAGREVVEAKRPGLRVPDPHHVDFRAGDVHHSQADIAKAQRLLGYAPTHDLRAGLREAFAWYAADYRR